MLQVSFKKKKKKIDTILKKARLNDSDDDIQDMI